MRDANASPRRDPLGTAGRALTAAARSAVGVLAMALVLTACQNFQSREERGALNIMTSDLRNLHSAQEIYFSEHGRYIPSLELLEFFAESDPVDVWIRSDDWSAGFEAAASHELVDEWCFLSVGRDRAFPGRGPAGARLPEGEVACEDR